MPTFEVGLARYFAVTIEAQNLEEALRLSEFFLGNCNDSSSEEERQEYQFQIKEIKMAQNEAFQL